MLLVAKGMRWVRADGEQIGAVPFFGERMSCDSGGVE